MNYVDTLLSSSRLIQRRVKLSTCSGLERHLIDELNNLSLKFSLVSRGKSYIDISTGLDTIWSIIQNSRICRQLFIHVVDPFNAETTKKFVSELNSADWASFIPFSHKLPTPSVKVLSHNSKLYHTGMIRNIVEGVINSHCYKYKQMQGDELPEYMKKRGYISICPKITVNIDNNNCQVLADASGDLSERAWHSLSLLNDRMIPTASAAIIQELISREAFKNKSTIWDPFCHNGSFLLEILSYLKDDGLRSESAKFPLNNFPLSTVLYDQTHLTRSNITTNLDLLLLGTDPDPNKINSANELINKLEAIDKDNINHLFVDNNKNKEYNNEINENNSNSLNSVNNTNNLKIKFECNKINEVKLNLKETVILTNLYYGDKNMKLEYGNYCREFVKFVRKVKSKATTIYVIAPKSFKHTSKLSWETVLEFNNNGILVELLKLK